MLKIKTPKVYESIINKYLGAIKQAKRSRVKVDTKSPIFYVGPKTASYSLKWYACAIVHDAYHCKQFSDYKIKYNKVPHHVFYSPKAELECIKEELKVARKLKLPKKDIDYKKSLDGNYIYWEKKDW